MGGLAIPWQANILAADRRRNEGELQRRHEKLIERYQRKESDSKFVLRQITKIKS